MILILLAAGLIVAAVLCLILVIRLLMRRGRFRGPMIYHDGTDVKSGRLGNGGNIFQRAPYPTLVVGKRRHGRPGWQMIFLDRRTGHRYPGQLTEQTPLVLGRGIPGRQTDGVLGIGTTRDISHRQFAITADSHGPVLTNIGQQAAASADGAPFTGPVRLQPGTTLRAGSACVQILQLGQIYL